MNGMVLEGGAMRGLYTAGALDVLLENNITVDGYIGVSAGVTFGCNYKSNQAGRAIRYNIKYLNHPKFSGVKVLLKTGDIFGSDFCYHEIPERLDPFDYETFFNNPIKLYCVVTDANTGKSIYHEFPTSFNTDVEWMRASSSMPIVSKAVKIDGLTLFDGSVSDSIPIKYFMSLGYDKNLVILTRPWGYRKEEKKLPLYTKIALRNYPNLLKTMEERSRVYNSTLDLLDKLKNDKKVLILAPSVDLHVKRVEKDEAKVQAIYDLGRKDTLEMLDKIKEFFGKVEK